MRTRINNCPKFTIYEMTLWLTGSLMTDGWWVLFRLPSCCELEGAWKQEPDEDTKRPMLCCLMIAAGFNEDDIRRKNCEELQKREDSIAAIANTFSQLHKPRVSGCFTAVCRNPYDREQT